MKESNPKNYFIIRIEVSLKSTDSDTDTGYKTDTDTTQTWCILVTMYSIDSKIYVIINNKLRTHQDI